MSAETRGRQKPARELAARALCRYEGLPEDTQFEGKPMWESYLAEADAVLGGGARKIARRSRMTSEQRIIGRVVRRFSAVF